MSSTVNVHDKIQINLRAHSHIHSIYCTIVVPLAGLHSISDIKTQILDQRDSVVAMTNRQNTYCSCPRELKDLSNSSYHLTYDKSVEI